MQKKGVVDGRSYDEDDEGRTGDIDREVEGGMTQAVRQSERGRWGLGVDTGSVAEGMEGRLNASAMQSRGLRYDSKGLEYCIRPSVEVAGCSGSITAGGR